MRPNRRVLAWRADDATRSRSRVRARPGRDATADSPLAAGIVHWRTAMLRVVLVALLFSIAVAAWIVWRRERLRRQIALATAEFARRRPTLQEDFRAAANVSGKPRGLRWKSC